MAFSRYARLGALAVGLAGLGLAQAPQCPTPPVTEARPWLNRAYSGQCRAQFVLAALKTVDDKFAFLNSGTGSNQRNVMGELQLNRGGGSDGPAGVARGNGVTAFPTPLTVAASFDPKIAERYGNLLGEEFFDAGLNSVLGPAMDMARTWRFGRVTESFGEDPFLAAAVAAPEVAAIQSHHVITTLKHFAAYTQEQGRVGDQPSGTGPAVNQQIGERALREIYLPAFEAAVTKGGGAGIMCSFPKINGVYACENTYTLGILRNEWGFDGIVSPDFPDAQRTIVPAFLAGLDSGTMNPTGVFAGQKSLRQGFDEGQVPMSRIDDLILRRLVPGFRLGVFDNPAKRKGDDVSTPERRAAAAEVIAAGAVLLKNDKNVLPLSANVKKLAIIGTQAGENPVVVEQGSPWVRPTHLAPVLPAVQSRAGQTKVVYEPGTLGLGSLPAIPEAMLKTPTGEPGIRVEYFANAKRDFSGTALAVRTEPGLLLDKTPVIEALPAGNKWSARYTTMFTPAKTGVQKFTLTGAGQARLYVGGKFMGEFVRADFTDTIYANVPMTAGKLEEIRIEYTPREALGAAKREQFGIIMGLTLRLGWAGPNDLIERAAAAAKSADVAVVFVGQQIGEGMDRTSLALPNDQNELIEAVAKANPRTVVVLNTGGAVTMPWLNRVAAVLEMWLPGDAYGPAAAKLLFGDAEPGGRMPVTFPKDETQGPATKPEQYPGTLLADGGLDTAHYDEGIFIGYRYWDQYKQTPLFPFGYGLGYTTFSMKGLGAKAAGNGATVDVLVKNTGSRASSEVVQVYLGFPKTAGEPPKQLKGLGKVTLKPGEERTVSISLDADAFRYWDEQAHRWATARGEYEVMVGRSSRDIVWTGKLAK